MSRRFVWLWLALLVVPALSHAQSSSSDGSRWGVAVSFIPKFEWRTSSGSMGKLVELFLTGADNGGAEVTGRDFRVSLVRGRRLSGDWGVSLVQRSFKDSSRQGLIADVCAFGQNGPDCSIGHNLDGEEFLYRDVTLRGLEVNKFIAFATIKERVQIGLDVAGGFGTLKGSAEHRTVNNTFTNVTNSKGQIVGYTTVSTIETEAVDAKELFAVDPTLIGRLEFAVSVIATRAVKVRASGGMNFPGQHTASVTGLYFF